MTKNKWLKCDTILTNQTFYIPIVYIITTLGEAPVFSNPVNDKFNFIEPIVLTAGVWESEKLPETNESIATKIGDALKKNEYNEVIRYIDEYIRRNPFNKELYQLRMSINGITLCKFQGGAWWCAVGGFTPDFPCPSDRKSHATRPRNLHLNRYKIFSLIK
jgi:hypothetical protein